MPSTLTGLHCLLDCEIEQIKCIEGEEDKSGKVDNLNTYTLSLSLCIKKAAGWDLGHDPMPNTKGKGISFEPSWPSWSTPCVEYGVRASTSKNTVQRRSHCMVSEICYNIE